MKGRVENLKKQKGFTLVELLIVLAILIITIAGGKLIWEKKILPTPIPTPTISKEPTLTLIPSEAETTKIPWEDSICGNGICEQCESRSECCNYPCVTDSKTGNQVCPPPTCLGWCPQDCQDGFKNTNALESCLKEAENLRKRVCEEMKIPLDEYGNCVGVDFVKDPYQECYDKYGQK